MKKVYIMLGLCLLLAGCGRADGEELKPETAVESPAVTAEPTPSPEPLVRITQEERIARQTVSAEEWLADYTNWGKLYALNDDYEQFMELPQDEPAVFVVYNNMVLGPAETKLNDFACRYTPLEDEIREIYDAARQGLKIQGYTYGADTSQWEWDDENVDRRYLPLEYFQLRDRMREIWAEIGPQYEGLMKQRDGERNQFCLDTAKLFAEAGVKAEVWALRSVEDYEEQVYYICYITLSPKQLWELGESIDKTFFVGPQYESVRLRFDVPVWSSGDGDA